MLFTAKLQLLGLMMINTNMRRSYPSSETPKTTVKNGNKNKKGTRQITNIFTPLLYIYHSLPLKFKPPTKTRDIIKTIGTNVMYFSVFSHFSDVYIVVKICYFLAFEPPGSKRKQPYPSFSATDRPNGG